MAAGESGARLAVPGPGAEVVIAVNLNGDLLGRRFTPEAWAAKRSENSPRQALGRLLEQLPAPLRDQAAAIAPRLLDPGPDTPGYFEVLANSLNIMQDQITRMRLAEEPPEVLLTPRLRTSTCSTITARRHRRRPRLRRPGPCGTCAPCQTRAERLTRPVRRYVVRRMSLPGSGPTHSRVPARGRRGP